jgi:hypothetical protein
MSSPPPCDLTPVERLQASRRQLRSVLLEAQKLRPSVLESLIQGLGAEQPLQSGLVALLAGLIMATRTWRRKAITPSWLTWASIAVTAWANSYSRKS